MIIYKVTNKINGKLYIGQTVQKLKDRWHDHVRGDKQPEGYLHRAIQKYGVENFTIEEIDSSKSVEGLNALEEVYIKKFSTLAPNGYNLHPGGLNKQCHSDTKEKIRNTLKGRPIANRWNRGNTVPPSKETKAKISAKLKGKPIKDRYTGGNKTPRTEDQKAHLSALNKGKSNVALYKKVLCIETGVVYESVNAAAKALKVSRVTISQLIRSGGRGRIKKHFKFVK